MNEIDTSRLDELKYLERAARTYARHEADSRLRRYRNQALIGFVILAVGLGIAINDNSTTAHEASHAAHEAGQAARAAATIPDLHAASVSECQRVNILRAQSNISNDVSFVILSDAAGREASLAHFGGRSATIHGRSARSFVRNAKRLKVTRLTDCRLADTHARSYRFPLAGPIGDPLTGKQAPGVRDILRASDALVAQHSQHG